MLKLHQWLKGMLRAEVEETSGSRGGGTSLRVLLKRPTPLLNLLETMPEVLEVREERREAGLKNRRFLKRRKEQPKLTATSVKRVRLLLESQFTPKQLTMGLE